MERQYLELKKELLEKIKDSRYFYNGQKTSDMRFYFLCLTGLETGARISDLLKLSWSSFDVQNNILSYHNTKSGKNQKAKFSNDLRLAYEDYKQMFFARGEIVRYYFEIEKHEDEYKDVFYNFDKRVVMSRVSATRRSKTEFGFGFHEFRRISAKYSATKHGLLGAKTLLGHSRATTTDRYLNLSEDAFLNSHAKFV